MINSERLELLAPAKDIETGRTAIDCGADAVYIGPPAFGARAAAGNSIDDIGRLADYAHRFGARVYATMNTILFDNELEQARRMALDLYDAGTDALIVQDMAYLMMDLPIALHASTQCDIRTPEKAEWLAKAGFTRLVLPREFSTDEIAASAKAAGIPVEVFIHGARCVSYSGDCQMGFAANGRSANRGVCPQMCRLPYVLEDKNGRTIGKRRYYLSLSDLSTPSLGELADAGARSFKIEGRLKDRRYVANAVAWYSARLDELIVKSGGRYVRSSAGRAEPGFVPDITKGFFRRPNGGGKQGCLSSPNDTGIAVGTATSAYMTRTRSFKIDGKALANGDGLGYFSPDGNFTGFRLNRSDGSTCFPANPLYGLEAGTVIMRNSDKTFNDSIDHACPRRRMRVDFRLERKGGDRAVLTATDETGTTAELSFAAGDTAAITPQEEPRRQILSRLGESLYYPGSISDKIGGLFIPAALLTAVRRQVLEQLGLKRATAYSRPRPGICTLPENAFADMPPLTYHDNVANSSAEKFYTAHGAITGEQAMECSAPADTAGKRVMSTRYCLRRELGACLHGNNAPALPTPLFLVNESGKYRVDFDCDRCGMNIIKVK